MSRVASLLTALALVSCQRAPPEPEDDARALQHDLHRAFISTRSLGRFGELGLFEEAMETMPCQVPLSPQNRICDVALQGRGQVRMIVADAELEKGDQLRKDALVAVEYQVDCDNQRFDFKTMDNVLQRGATQDGVTVWENKLLRVTHRRSSETPRDRCTLVIDAAPVFLARIKSVGARMHSR